MTADPWLIDDRAGRSPATWRCFSDTVMGGISQARLSTVDYAGRSALCLRGRVRTEFNGGFVQMACDVPEPPASAMGLSLDVAGNGRTYGVHLRTRDLSAPWQAWRARFVAGPAWQTVSLRLADFVPYRCSGTLQAPAVCRVGLVALAVDGEPFEAELYLARVAWVP